MTGFEEFFGQHYEAVVRALTLVFGERHRAEDLAQDAFARAYRQWRQVRDMDHPVGWVYVVALNRGRRELGRSHPEAQAAAELEFADPTAGVATALTVQAALQTLTARQRAAVVLRYGADLSVREVSEALACAVGTAKATLHAALSRLRVELDEGDDED